MPTPALNNLDARSASRVATACAPLSASPPAFRRSIAARRGGLVCDPYSLTRQLADQWLVKEPVSSQADFFRKRAAEMRELGNRAPTATQQSKFEEIAAEYDTLARQSEKEALRVKG